jgi:hypothetical protein
MAATPREIVEQTLSFAGPPRAPRQLWALPWAEARFPSELRAIRADYPDDIAGVGGYEREWPATQGDPYVVGTSVDAWGARFVNVQAGVHGEVRDPLITDWATDVAKVHVPREWLTIDRDAINRDCAATDRFTMGGCCPRPFEQLQFLRGSENLYLDLGDPSAEMLAFLAEMHAFYCELMEAWAATDVDALSFMDDWGSQLALLIRPQQWRELFKPLYRDYAQIAHGAGKRVFMHSDGHILSVYPDLVEIGVDAVNSQLFCMGLENLAPFAGQITFWGEMDRQGLLPSATTDGIDEAVRRVHDLLWRNGGCIAQCEFGAGARPENVRQVYASWDAVTA